MRGRHHNGWTKYVDALLALRLGGSGVAGITQLTDDVLAGPGTGAQAATVVKWQHRPVSAAAPTTGQVPTWDGAQWAPASPASAINGVKLLFGALSAGGTVPGGGIATLIASQAVTAAAGQQFLVRGYVNLVDTVVEGVSSTGVWSITIQLALDGTAVEGLQEVFEWTNAGISWERILPIELRPQAGLSAGVHTFSLVVTTNNAAIFTTASKIIVEQLIPSG